MNNSDIKSDNIKAVQSYFLDHDTATRSILAKELHLSKMTVTNIVNGLLKNGFIEEIAQTPASGKGRPASVLQKRNVSPRLINLYLGLGSFKISYLDFALKSFSDTVIPTQGKIAKDLVSEIDAEINKLAREHLNEQIVGIAVGTESDFDEKDLINTETSLGIKDFCILQHLKNTYGLPLSVSSSLECLALLENRLGNLKDTKEALILQFGSHIKSVIIHERKILKCNRREEARFGHISIDYNGLSCECGNRGCMEAYASASAIEKKLRDITKLKLDFRGFCELQGKKNDSRIDWALKDMIDKLSVALIAYSNLLHPEIIVIAGEAFYLPDRYLARLQKTLKEKVVSSNQEEIKIIKSHFKNQGIEIGSALPCIENYVINN